MPEEFLDATQVVAGFEQVGREGVPEQVWIDLCVDALAASPVVDACLHATPAKASAAIADEQGLLVPGVARPTRELSPSGNASPGPWSRPARSGPCCPCRSTRTVASRRRHRRGIRSVSSARRSPEEYSNSRMARSRSTSGPSPGISSNLAMRSASRFSGRRLPPLGRGYGLRPGSVRDVLLAQQVTVRSASRRQAPLNAAGRQAASEAGGRPGADLFTVEVAPVFDFRGFAERAQLDQVATIILAGLRREPPLVFEVVEEAVDPVGFGSVHRDGTGSESLSARRRRDRRRATGNRYSCPGESDRSRHCRRPGNPNSAFSPSGINATDPISSASLLNRNSRWASRT